MKPECDLKFCDGYACLRPSGKVSFQEAVEVISEGISLARSRGVQCLLVNTTDLTGFRPPNTAERFLMAEQWASIASGVRLAVIARAELIDSDRFGVTVARNRGLITSVFTSEVDAIEWLLDPKAE